MTWPKYRAFADSGVAPINQGNWLRHMREFYERWVNDNDAFYERP
jgi:hypothetical protein